MTSIHSGDYEHVIELLAEARKVAGISQQELANALSRPQSFVSKFERRERRLDIVEFVHICELIGVDATLLLEKAGVIAPATLRRKVRHDRPASALK